MSRGVQDDRPILKHFCALAVGAMPPAMHAPHCGETAIKARKVQVIRLRCTRLGRTSVIKLPPADGYAAPPDELIPGNARMWRPSDIFWK